MLIIKSFHIVFIASWFAGLFYLPRIFVNLAMENNEAAIDRLQLMARKLYRFMTLLAIPALLTGFWLSIIYGIGHGQGWLQIKVILVFLMIIYHFYCGLLLKKFEKKQNKHSHKWYRFFNEIPVLGMLIIVWLAVAKPF